LAKRYQGPFFCGPFFVVELGVPSLPGLVLSRSGYPGLTPWANECRRFAAVPSALCAAVPPAMHRARVLRRCSLRLHAAAGLTEGLRLG
jgi:hypothetical protein